MLTHILSIFQQSASIYVCGDAKHMAHDVLLTLIDIAKGQGHLNQMEAEEYVCNLEIEERYQKDVWVV